jgi:hypothetical protein
MNKRKKGRKNDNYQLEMRRFFGAGVKKFA